MTARIINNRGEFVKVREDGVVEGETGAARAARTLKAASLPVPAPVPAVTPAAAPAAAPAPAAKPAAPAKPAAKK